MPSGIFASVNLADGVLTDLYTIAAGRTGSFSVNFCNPSDYPVAIRLAISPTGSPSAANYFQYDLEIPPKSNFERTGLVAQAGHHILAMSIYGAVAVNVYGFEE